MRRDAVLVNGEYVTELADRIQDELSAEYRYDGDGFAVLALEKYEAWGVNSNMQTTVILEPEGTTVYRIELVVGGGAAGAFQVTLGAEKEVLASVGDRIEAVCDDLGLEMKEPPEATGES